MNTARLPPALYNGLEHAREVGPVATLKLLEYAVAAQVGVDRPGQQQQRGRVDVGGRHPDRRVGCARTDRGEGGQRPTTGPEIAVRQMDRRLLVHHLERLQAVAIVLKGIQHGPDAVPGDPDRVRHLCPRQVLRDDLATAQPTSPRAGRYLLLDTCHRHTPSLCSRKARDVRASRSGSSPERSDRIRRSCSTTSQPRYPWRTRSSRRRGKSTSPAPSGANRPAPTAVGKSRPARRARASTSARTSLACTWRTRAPCRRTTSNGSAPPQTRWPVSRQRPS